MRLITSILTVIFILLGCYTLWSCLNGYVVTPPVSGVEFILSSIIAVFLGFIAAIAIVEQVLSYMVKPLPNKTH